MTQPHYIDRAADIAARLDVLWLELNDAHSAPPATARILNAMHDASHLLKILSAPMEAVACPHEAWSVDSVGQQTHCVDCGCAHPAPIKPSGDTGELRERVAQIIEAAIERHNPELSFRHTIDDADAILDLIQSERAG